MKAERVDTPDGRFYKHPKTGKPHPSVTTIIGEVWPSTFLEAWKNRNCAQRMVENAELVHKRFKKIKKHRPGMRELYAPKVAKLIGEWREDYTAADRGTRIHEGLEKLLLGTSQKKIKKQMEPSEYAVMLNASALLEARGFEMEYTEVPAYGRSHSLYAGTIDIVGSLKINRRGRTKKIKAVIDLKTGARIGNYLSLIHI